MKKYILTTLALILTAGTFDASAQSLLKKLGQQAIFLVKRKDVSKISFVYGLYPLVQAFL